MECGVCGGRKGYYRIVAEIRDGEVVERREWVDCSICHGTGQGPSG